MPSSPRAATTLLPGRGSRLTHGMASGRAASPLNPGAARSHGSRSQGASRPTGTLPPVPHLFHPAWARSEWRLAANRAAGPHNRARRGPPPSLLIEAEGARSRGPSARRAGTTSGPERKWRATCAPRRNKLWYARLSVPGRAADPARGQKADGRMVLAGGPRALRHAPCKSVASRRDHGSVAALHRLCCSNRGKKGSPQKAVQ